MLQKTARQALEFVNQAKRAPSLPQGLAGGTTMMLGALTVVFAVVAYVYVQKRRARKKATA
jgi:hypothetical protein